MADVSEQCSQGYHTQAAQTLRRGILPSLSRVAYLDVGLVRLNALGREASFAYIEAQLVLVWIWFEVSGPASLLSCCKNVLLICQKRDVVLVFN